jgi:geranylgeranyl diphosphate synthase, type I
MIPEKQKDMIAKLLEMGELVDPVIKDILNSHMSLKLKPALNYQISAGGKRLRPVFVFASSFLLGGRIKECLYPAAGIEIIHNYSLIVDDIIDNSEIRRGKPTVWKKYGKDIAQCIAIAYSASIFQAACYSKNPILVSEIFAQTIKEIVEGEILDILYERAGREKEPYVTKNRYRKISVKDYLEMISKKTARLCATSCEIGAVSAQATKKQASLLSDYGFNVGVAFQIQDDILDIFGNLKSFGKEIGKDIKERKGGNIVILLALEELKGKKRKELSSILEKKKIMKSDLEKAVQLIGETKAREKAHSMAKRYIKKAKSSLKELPDNKWNQTLAFFSDFVISREK